MLQDLVREAGNFLLKGKQVIEETIEGVLQSILQWKQLFRKHGVPEDDITVLGRDVEPRIERILSF